jgi:hypothetical protein
MGVRASGAGAAGVQVMRGECVTSTGGGRASFSKRKKKGEKSCLLYRCTSPRPRFDDSSTRVRTTGSSLASSRAGAVGEIFAFGLPAIGRRA